MTAKRLFNEAVSTSRGTGTKASGSSHLQRRSQKVVSPVAAQASSAVSRVSAAALRDPAINPGRLRRHATAAAKSNVVANRSAVDRVRVIQYPGSASTASPQRGLRCSSWAHWATSPAAQAMQPTFRSPNVQTISCGWPSPMIQANSGYRRRLPR